jgi:hypothetical protein
MSLGAALPGKTPPAAVHVDLDGATDIFHAHGWQYHEDGDPLFETGMRNLLDLLERNGLRATLFLIASSLDHPEKRRLVEEALQRGHEIASHSITHPNLLRLTREEKRKEIEGSRRTIESALGVTVGGFRAPGYSIDREGLEILAAAGYTYDSSVQPTKAFAQRLGANVEALLAPHCVPGKSRFWELPLPDYRPSLVPFSPSYSLLFGFRYFQWGLERFRRRDLPLIFLLHLTDVADPLPADRLIGLASRIFTLSILSRQKKLARCQAMLDLVKQNFRLITTRELIQECSAQTRHEDSTVGRIERKNRG